MADQQLITEYPTQDERHNLDDDPSGEPVRFDLEADSSSIERARDVHDSSITPSSLKEQGFHE